MSKRRGTHCRELRESSKDFRGEEWIDSEVVGCKFRDARRGKRLRQILEKLPSGVGSATPWACQDSANTKAAYRFFSNDRIGVANILAGHFASTRERFVSSGSDRESDIWELFCLARQLGTHFLVRTCVDRVAADVLSRTGRKQRTSQSSINLFVLFRLKRGIHIVTQPTENQIDTKSNSRNTPKSTPSCTRKLSFFMARNRT
jgi:hypothetical protein